MKLIFIIIMITIIASQLIACRSCKREADPEITVTSGPILLEMAEKEKSTKESGPRIRRIEIGPSGRSLEEGAQVEESQPSGEETQAAKTDLALPPDTFEETDLTARLREKMMDAYAGKEEALPDVKIYLSEMKYDEFVNYYKNLGYHVNTVAVPATEVIEPVLEQRPELTGKVKLADYEGIVIHQVMVDGAGISAADKYIDPDTFEVIDKTFVTKMNK